MAGLLVKVWFTLDSVVGAAKQQPLTGNTTNQTQFGNIKKLRTLKPYRFTHLYTSFAFPPNTAAKAFGPFV